MTPLALAIWIMDDGYICGKCLKLATNCFWYNNYLNLIKVLLDNLKFKASFQSAVGKN